METNKVLKTEFFAGVEIKTREKDTLYTKYFKIKNNNEVLEKKITVSCVSVPRFEVFKLIHENIHKYIKENFSNYQLI
jgi:adenosine deaminase